MEDEVESKAHAARCSFCRKGSAEVNVLIAGPGVYICNECVDMTADIIRKLGRVENKTPFNVVEHFRSFDSEKLLSLVGKIEPVYQDVAGQQALMVDILRERQVSWADIGEALGVTRQAVWRRFAKGPDGA